MTVLRLKMGIQQFTTIFFNIQHPSLCFVLSTEKWLAKKSQWNGCTFKIQIYLAFSGCVGSERYLRSHQLYRQKYVYLRLLLWRVYGHHVRPLWAGDWPALHCRWETPHHRVRGWMHICVEVRVGAFLSKQQKVTDSEGKFLHFIYHLLHKVVRKNTKLYERIHCSLRFVPSSYPNTEWPQDMKIGMLNEVLIWDSPSTTAVGFINTPYTSQFHS